EAMALFQARERRDGILDALESLAVAALARGQKEHAARLQGAVQAQREALGLLGWDRWSRPRERMREAVRGAQVEHTFPAAWAEGQAMSLDEAVDLALAEVTDV